MVFLFNCLYQITAYEVLLIFRFDTFIAFFYMFEHLLILILNLFRCLLHCSYLSFPILILLIKNSLFMELLSHELMLKCGHFILVVHMTLDDCWFVWIVTTFVLQSLRARPFQICLTALLKLHWWTQGYTLVMFLDAEAGPATLVRDVESSSVVKTEVSTFFNHRNHSLVVFKRRFTNVKRWSGLIFNIILV